MEHHFTNDEQNIEKIIDAIMACETTVERMKVLEMYRDSFAIGFANFILDQSIQENRVRGSNSDFIKQYKSTL